MPEPTTVCPTTGKPGTSPTTKSPPEVWASASRIRSSSVTPPGSIRCGRTQSRLRRDPPGTKPSRNASRAPSSTGSEGGGGSVPIECDHRRDRLSEHLSGLLVPVVEQTESKRLGQGQRQAGLSSVVAQQSVRVSQTGDGHAVL